MGNLSFFIPDFENQCSIIFLAFHPYKVLFPLGQWPQVFFRHFTPYDKRPIWPYTYKSCAHLIYFSYILEKLDINPPPPPRVETLHNYIWFPHELCYWPRQTRGPRLASLAKMISIVIKGFSSNASGTAVGSGGIVRQLETLVNIRNNRLANN